MSDIDAQISRRRKGGGAGAGQRGAFSVDRARAIEKMRHFALENPQFYLLELVQAAIANDAGFIDIDLFRLRADLDDLKFRWEGRGFNDIELGRLFDFLFLSEDEPGCADTMLLARGVNAMLHFHPATITITAGDGTVEGTFRALVRPGMAAPQLVDVTTPLSGVFIHAERLYRSLLPPDPGQELGDREVALLTDKCIAPEVQVMLNGRFVSDWDSAYMQQLAWESDFVEIDEPDLYGRLWKPPAGQQKFFDVMTWGVKIERVRFGGPLAGVSGAVNFNRLNKTADHARIVRDEVFDELEARLRPYAELLKRGGTAATFAIRNLAGRRYNPADLVDIVHGARRIVVVEPATLDDDHKLAAARAVGATLQAPILVASADEQQTLRMLAGSTCELIAPRLGRPRDVEALTGPAAPPLARPWHLATESIDPVPMDEFARALCHEQGVSARGRARVEQTLGDTGRVVVHAYAGGEPAELSAEQAQRWVEVLVCDRVVWNEPIPVLLPGHRLRVHLPPMSPSDLDQPVSMGRRNRSLAYLVAQTAVSFAGRFIHALSPQARRARDEARDEIDFLLDAPVAERLVHGVLGLPARETPDVQVVLIERISGRVRRASGIGGDYPVIGWLVVDAALLADDEELAALVSARGRRLLERLVARAARITDSSRRRRAQSILLDFAARHLDVRREPNGRVVWTVAHPVARRILDLPLFPSARHTAVSGMWLVRRFCAAHGAGGVELFELADDAPAFVREWVEQSLRSWTAEPPVDARAGVDGDAGVDDHRSQGADLCAVLATWLNRLGPAGAPTALSVAWAEGAGATPPGICWLDGADTVRLDRAHPLVRRVFDAPSAAALAWLLLAVYAELSAAHPHVDSAHERAFISRLVVALVDGRLAGVAPAHDEQHQTVNEEVETR